MGLQKNDSIRDSFTQDGFAQDGCIAFGADAILLDSFKLTEEEMSCSRTGKGILMVERFASRQLKGYHFRELSKSLRRFEGIFKTLGESSPEFLCVRKDDSEAALLLSFPVFGEAVCIAKVAGGKNTFAYLANGPKLDIDELNDAKLTGIGLLMVARNARTGRYEERLLARLCERRMSASSDDTEVVTDSEIARKRIELLWATAQLLEKQLEKSRRKAKSKENGSVGEDCKDEAEAADAMQKKAVLKEIELKEKIKSELPKDIAGRIKFVGVELLKLDIGEEPSEQPLASQKYNPTTSYHDFSPAEKKRVMMDNLWVMVKRQKEDGTRLDLIAEFVLAVRRARGRETAEKRFSSVTAALRQIWDKYTMIIEKENKKMTLPAGGRATRQTALPWA